MSAVGEDALGELRPDPVGVGVGHLAGAGVGVAAAAVGEEQPADVGAASVRSKIDLPTANTMFCFCRPHMTCMEMFASGCRA